MNQFRDSQTKELKNLTSGQFIEVWSHYDKDGKLFFILSFPRFLELSGNKLCTFKGLKLNFKLKVKE